jgi:hypothetical protein
MIVVVSVESTVAVVKVVLLADEDVEFVTFVVLGEACDRVTAAMGLSSWVSAEVVELGSGAALITARRPRVALIG